MTLRADAPQYNAQHPKSLVYLQLRLTPMLLRNLSTCLLAASIYGCSEPPAPKRFVPYELEGLTVPGLIDNAKNSGFTDCKVDYYAYKCERSRSQEVFGVQPIMTSVSLNGDDNLQIDSTNLSPGDVRSLPPEKLSYRQIDIELRPDVYDESCVKKLEPKSPPDSTCIKTKGTQVFMENLRKSGWIEHEWKSYKNFLHEGIPIEISVQPYQNRVTIRPEVIDLVDDRLMAIAQAKSEEKKKQEKASAVLKHMKE